MKLAVIPDTRFRFLDEKQDGLHAGQEFGPRLGRLDRPRGAGQQTYAEAGFQLGDHSRGLRLRQPAFARGRREAAEPGHPGIELEYRDVFHRATNTGSLASAPQRPPAPPEPAKLRYPRSLVGAMTVCTWPVATSYTAPEIMKPPGRSGFAL